MHDKYGNSPGVAMVCQISHQLYNLIFCQNQVSFMHQRVSRDRSIVKCYRQQLGHCCCCPALDGCRAQCSTAARNKTEFHLHNYTPLNYHYAGTGVEENNHFKQFLPMQCSVCFISNLRRDIFSCLCLKDICCHWNQN